MRKDLDGSGQEEWAVVDGLQLPAGNDSSFLAGQPASCPATRGGASISNGSSDRRGCAITFHYCPLKVGMYSPIPTPMNVIALLLLENCVLFSSLSSVSLPLPLVTAPSEPPDPMTKRPEDEKRAQASRAATGGSVRGQRAQLGPVLSTPGASRCNLLGLASAAGCQLCKVKMSGTGRVRLGRGMAWSKADEAPPPCSPPPSQCYFGGDALRCARAMRRARRRWAPDLGDLLIYHLGTEHARCTLPFFPCLSEPGRGSVAHFGALCSIDSTCVHSFTLLSAWRRASCPFPASRSCAPAGKVVQRPVYCLRLRAAGNTTSCWAGEEPTIVCRAAEAPKSRRSSEMRDCPSCSHQPPRLPHRTRARHGRAYAGPARDQPMQLS